MEDLLSAAVPPPAVLRDYAFLGDGERGAVVGPQGEVVWLCAPRWHDDAVFAALVGGPGHYTVRPQNAWRVRGGHYEDGTLIHVSRWVTDEAVIECREALALPGARDALVLLRRVRAVRGDARVHLVLDPRPGFGAEVMTEERGTADSRTAEGGGLHLWFGGAAVRRGPGGGWQGAFTVPEGEERDLVLRIGRRPPDTAPEPRRLWRQTAEAWRAAVPGCLDTAAPRDARHAFAVLHGLTSSSGGMVAAATTSLPERAEAGRNYDYRYTWIRDQCYAGLAVAAHGPHPLLDRAVRFVSARLLEDGDRLRPAYTVDGAPVADERPLPLVGYPGGSDFVGNRAGRQYQLDTYGEALQLLAAAARHGGLDRDGRRAVEVAVRSVERRWQRPDAGVWELEDRWWTHSRLSVVAGLRAVARDVPGPAAHSRNELADAVEAETRRRCLRSDGVWLRAQDDAGAEGALLLPMARGCLRPGDPSTYRTRRFIEEQLVQDGYLYRFRHGDRPLGEAEGAFLLCGFMMALAAHAGGDRITAFRWFERTRSACGTPGLFAEEYDVEQRQLRGNLPQAFVHALLLEAGARLTGPDPA
ncbi:glycoside hydrolase family 15 protein [Streptomyces sp. NPDC052496]|uniref:glycoside hydrolase family 15 protein n=1 Tax=Streptomyces sp. NPDC052496 TaxID=3154951 RepID=UPI00341BBDE9